MCCRSAHDLLGSMYDIILTEKVTETFLCGGVDNQVEG